MKEVSKEELFKVQLDMVQFIDRICRESGIQYSLSGGSLLGSIRHGGFIPWDDDIDLMLVRTEYNRLIEQILKSPEIDSNYTLIHSSQKNAYLPFAKLCDNRTYFESDLDTLNKGTGIFIDIFPMDIMPTDIEKAKKFKKKALLNNLKLASSKKGGTSYASASNRLYFIGKLILLAPWHFMYQNKYIHLNTKIDNFMQQYNGTNEKNIGYVNSWNKNEYMPKEIFESYEDIKFEDRVFRKIKNHNVYLEQLYGDYMTLPPENKRENHDYYKWYWKEGAKK